MLDIRIPIGLLFTAIGIITTIYGFATMHNTEMYVKSFNINVNIWSGLFMLVFGGGLLLFALKKKK